LLTESVLRGTTSAATTIFSFAISCNWFGIDPEPFRAALQDGCHFEGESGVRINSVAKVAPRGEVLTGVGMVRVHPAEPLAGARWTLRCQSPAQLASFAFDPLDASTGSDDQHLNLEFSLASAPTIREVRTHVPKGTDQQVIAVAMSEPVRARDLSNARLFVAGTPVPGGCARRLGACLKAGDDGDVEVFTMVLPRGVDPADAEVRLPATTRGPGGRSVLHALGGEAGGPQGIASQKGEDVAFQLVLAGWNANSGGSSRWVAPEIAK
jgi:hypothetical protein